MALALVARWVPVDAVEAAAVCVAGVELGDWHLVTSTFTLRGRCGASCTLRGRRRGSCRTGLALVARLGPS